MGSFRSLEMCPQRGLGNPNLFLSSLAFPPCGKWFYSAMYSCCHRPNETVMDWNSKSVSPNKPSLSGRCLFQYWGSWLTQVTPCCKMVAFISKANIRLKNALRNDHKLNISSKYYLLPKDLKKFSLFFLKEWVLKNNARKLLEVILCSFKLWPFYPLVFLNTALFYIPELLWSCLSS
jgi:hypothetical protein